jgi:hypothetical protein
MAFDGTVWMPGGDPPNGYTTTFTLPRGNPSPACFDGVQARLYAGASASGVPLADKPSTKVRVVGQPGATYTVVGSPQNGAFAWRPFGC